MHFAFITVCCDKAIVSLNKICFCFAKNVNIKSTMIYLKFQLPVIIVVNEKKKEQGDLVRGHYDVHFEYEP